MLLLVALTLFLLDLARLFPGSIRSDFDEAYLVRNIAVLALVSAGIVFSTRFKTSELVRNAALWGVAGLVLATGYVYRADLGSIGDRLYSELVPSYAVATSLHTLTLTASADGSFYITGSVNGFPVLFLIDTGASDIVLSPADAKRLGASATSLDFSHKFETANGVGYGAMIRVERLEVGPIRRRDITVSVNQAEMSTSLLGLAFLKNLDSFQVSGNHLFLKWRNP
jgi:aspartyl protease family protein